MADLDHARKELQSLFADWKSEHRQLEDAVDRVLESLSEREEAIRKATMPPPIGRSGLGETTAQLRELSDRLIEHFAKETRIGRLLAETRGKSTQEIESFRRKAEVEHRQLMNRLQEQIKAIQEAQLGTEQWREAVYNFGLFVDALEQHEDEEADNVSWLLPRSFTQSSDRADR